MSILVNIDVPDIATAVAFYTEGLGLRVGRRFDNAFVELLGASSAIYLLAKPAGSGATDAAPSAARTYERHWTPVHLDFVVDDIVAAKARALAAGATAETEITEHAYGRLVLMADPFGNGFCLLQFTGRGYDEIAQT